MLFIFPSLEGYITNGRRTLLDSGYFRQLSPDAKCPVLSCRRKFVLTTLGPYTKLPSIKLVAPFTYNKYTIYVHNIRISQKT